MFFVHNIRELLISNVKL